MLDLAIPVLYALAVWWLGTGIVLTVVRRRIETHRASAVIGLSLAIAALAVIAATAADATALSAYAGFTAAIVVWGFIELTFLTGLITGPNKRGALALGEARFRPAVAAVILHELALAAGGIAIWIAAGGAISATAFATYALLWVMRLCAKLNLFLGVPQLHDELMPAPIAHLRGHFRRRPISARLVICILASLGGAVCLGWLATTSSSAGIATGNALLATLLLLAALEHVFMLVPIPLMKMWDWNRRARTVGKTEISMTRRGL